MFKNSRGRHARRRARWVGPGFAVQAVLLALSAKQEMAAATAAQLAELSGEGAR